MASEHKKRPWSKPEIREIEVTEELLERFRMRNGSVLTGRRQEEK